MKKNTFSLYLRALFLTLFSFICIYPSTFWAGEEALKWNTLLEGLSEAQWSVSNDQGATVHFQIFKINLKQFRLEPFEARDFQLSTITIEELVQKTSALLGINGSFFDPNYKTLGLFIRGGKIISPLRPISWWGVFQIHQTQGAQVLRGKDFQMNAQIEMAIQAGPRLVENGNPVAVKSNISKKTFLGILSSNEILLGVTDASWIDAPELAKILAYKLHVKEALNLDGGSSTQLFAKIGNYKKNISGFNTVANGIVVLPREKK